MSLYNLGRARQKLGDWDAARSDYSGCLALSREINYPRGEAYGMLGLASVDNATNDPSHALFTLAQVGDAQRQAPDARLNGLVQLTRGTALRQLRRAGEALQALEQAQAAFEEGNLLEELGVVYNELATVHALMGDWQIAYKYRGQAQATTEKLLRGQLDQRFAALKIEFDTATKDKENALLMTQNAINQKALAQKRRANALQTVVIILSLLCSCCSPSWCCANGAEPATCVRWP